MDYTKDKIVKAAVLKETLGMWKNRKDIKDSVSYIDTIRKRENSRYGKIFG